MLICKHRYSGWILIVCALVVLSGCGAQTGDTSSEAASGNAETQVSMQGLGSDETINITHTEAIQKIGLPVYPNAKVVKESELSAGSDKDEDITYTARLRTEDSFEEVVKWYEKQMGVNATTARISNTRWALATAPRTGQMGARTVTISRRLESETTAITLIRYIPGK